MADISSSATDVLSITVLNFLRPNHACDKMNIGVQLNRWQSFKSWRADSPHGLFDRRIQQPWIMRYHGPNSDLPEEERMSAIARRIAEGNYDTPERIAAAVSDMFDREFDLPNDDSASNN